MTALLHHRDFVYIPKKCNNAGPKYERRRVTKIYPNLATRTHMYELVTKLGLRRTDNRFYYTMYSLSVARGARGGREGGRFPSSSRAPALAFLSRLKLPFPFPSKRLPRRLHFPQITHAADSRPAW